MVTGTSTTRASGDRPDVLPAAAVQAAGEPHGGPLGVEDLGPGEQVGGDRAEHRGDADADEHEPVAGDAPLVGEQVDGERGRARRRRARRRSPGSTCRATITMTNTAAAAAPALTPMMSGLASGLRARRWKMAPDSPKAAPTSSAVRPRGRRRVRTMKALSSEPPPTRVASTSPIGTGKSPTASDQANTTKATAPARRR